MARRPSTPLTKKQASLGAKLRLYVLLQPVVAQHDLDGGVVIPSGRMIFLLNKETHLIDYAYKCTELTVSYPYKADPRQGLPEGVVKFTATAKKPFQFIVCPAGQELVWLKDAAKRANIQDPCLR